MDGGAGVSVGVIVMVVRGGKDLMMAAVGVLVVVIVVVAISVGHPRDLVLPQSGGGWGNVRVWSIFVLGGDS